MPGMRGLQRNQKPVQKMTNFLKTGAPNDRFLGNDQKWLVMHPGLL